MPVTIGQTLGAYRLEALIGKGAFGQVFRAVAISDAEVKQGTRVAIKVLHDIHKDDERVVQRFHREARLATKLSHPHVVKVLGEGVDKGEHYLVMELAEGESLTEYLRKAGIEPPKEKTSIRAAKKPKQTGPAHVAQPPPAAPTQPAEEPSEGVEKEPPVRNLPIPEAIEILRQVAGVLQAAQDIGLVHRDIKPDNIFVYRDKAGKLQTKVLDFGIAKDMLAQSMSLSSMGGGMGTPAFMSPEQCSGLPLDTRSDLYSLGATAYQMLTGRPPFPGPTASAYMMQHLHDIPSSACKVNPNVPLNLSQVVDRLLAKKAEDRHQKPSDLIEDLNRVERGEVPLKLYKPKKARRYSTTVIVTTFVIGLLIAAGTFVGFYLLAADPFAEQVDKAQFHAKKGEVQVAIQILDDAIAKYKAFKPKGLSEAQKLREDLRRQLIETERAAEAERRRKAYEAAYEEAKTAFEKAQGSKDKDTWQGVITLAERAIATGHSDVSEAQRLLDEAKKHLGPPIPKGWTAEARRVKVATPDGDEIREITYYTNSIGMKLVLIPPGEFMMGDTMTPEEVDRKWPGGEIEWYKDAHPRHRVRLTKDFYIGAHEVTRGQFARFVNETGYKTDAEKLGKSWALKDNRWGWQDGVNWRNPLFHQTDDHPVECVWWQDAVEVCKRLSQKEGVEYRLPTEAEWEYACRAGSTTPFYTGATISTDQANYNGNYTYGPGRKGVYREKTTPVGSFPPNAFGLYDMHGNVWEWCADWYDANYYESSPADDPAGPPSGQYRLVRGGSWSRSPGGTRTADRGRDAPDIRSAGSGFRVVCSLR